MTQAKPLILLIATGGTISMVRNPKTGALQPADIDTFKDYISELDNEDVGYNIIAFNPMVDSSDVNPSMWSKLATIIYNEYNNYDGFVVLHGTDTMAYTASALSFMLENLNKPIVLTGSQLPMGVLRSDARENLLTAIEIASARDEEGDAIVPEVTVFFEDKLFRGNRTTKMSAEHFSAFASFNYEPLAVAGVHIKYYPHLVHYSDPDKPLRLHTTICNDVVVLQLFPGISETTVRNILSIPNLKAVVLETFGAGNAPSDQWLGDALSEATERGVIVVNKTQCLAGAVEMGRYATSLNLVSAGVISGLDITMEALLTKLMYLLGEKEGNTQIVKQLLQKSLCGEMTVDE